MQRLLAAFLLVTFASLAQAQADVSDAYKADIKQLLELTGALKQGEQLGNTVSQQMIAAMRAQKPLMPEKAFDIIREVTSKFIGDFMGSADTIAALTSSFARHFSQDEVKQLITFYQSPLGKKLAANQMPMAMESQTYVQGRLPALLPALQQELLKRFAAEGISLQ